MSLTINFIRTKWRVFISSHPLIRGSISYAILWPTGSFIQQTLEGKSLTPTLYGWVKLTSAMWPHMSLKIGLLKASIEQISYGPFACASFFMGMSLLELKTFSEAIDETKEKFLPTFKVGIFIWPILQTINFSMIPEKNRLVFVSICSLMWTTFLAYMKRKEFIDHLDPDHQTTSVEHKKSLKH
ncbi:mpv17-like protein isoform 4-T6 [Cochliomyia hominivorax]